MNHRVKYLTVVAVRRSRSDVSREQPDHDNTDDDELLFPRTCVFAAPAEHQCSPTSGRDGTRLDPSRLHVTGATPMTTVVAAQRWIERAGTRLDLVLKIAEHG